MMEIKQIDLDTVLGMRQRIMYPMQTRESMRLPDDDAGQHLAVFKDGIPLSVISLFKREGDWQFRKFATEINYQGQGFGTMLLEYVFDLTQKENAKRIWCNARLSATALYERFGMRASGQPWEKNEIEFIVMEKLL